VTAVLLAFNRRDAVAKVVNILIDLGLDEIRGHLLFAVPDDEMRKAAAWLVQVGLMPLIERTLACFEEANAAGYGAQDGAAIPVYWSKRGKK